MLGHQKKNLHCFLPKGLEPILGKQEYVSKYVKPIIFVMMLETGPETFHLWLLYVK
jgi:hypothetical protein